MFHLNTQTFWQNVYVFNVIVHIFLPLSICRVYQKGLTLYFVTILGCKIFCKIGCCIELLPSRIVMYDVASPQVFFNNFKVQGLHIVEVQIIIVSSPSLIPQQFQGTYQGGRNLCTSKRFSVQCLRLCYYFPMTKHIIYIMTFIFFQIPTTRTPSNRKLNQYSM